MEDDQDNMGGPMNLEQTSEKRIRREIANSNERRRMQSINAGFSSLRNLLPHHEGEKLSKAAILQQTAEYIYSLEQEKTRLLSQNCQLKRLLGQTQHVMETDEIDSGPAPKRRLIDTGQKLLFEEENEEIAEIQNKYERERRTRMQLEEKINTLMSQFGSGAQGIVTSRSSGLTDMSVAPVNLENFPLDGRVEIIESVGGLGQTILAPADKKGMETIIFQTTSGDKLPSIIQVKDGSKVEVAHLPRLPEFVSADGSAGTALEITSVQDPETGATRQYILTTQMGSDSGPSKNLETIVEAIRHLEGDHLFSEETGPHQVVKEEVVESTISLNEDSTMVEMTLPASITGQVQIPVSTLVSLHVGPVTFSLANSTSSQGTGTISSGKLNTNSLPMLPQVPVSISQLAGVTSIQQLDLKHFQPANILGTDPIELANIGPPQTSPVNLELATSGNITPTSEISTVSDTQGHLTNSPPQSSPVNLAQSQANDQ
jgi:transcription factor AP-4